MTTCREEEMSELDPNPSKVALVTGAERLGYYERK
jgi:hypothetical protein